MQVTQEKAKIEVSRMERIHMQQDEFVTDPIYELLNG